VSSGYILFVLHIQGYSGILGVKKYSFSVSHLTVFLFKKNYGAV